MGPRALLALRGEVWPHEPAGPRIVAPEKSFASATGVNPRDLMRQVNGGAGEVIARAAGSVLRTAHISLGPRLGGPGVRYSDNPQFGSAWFVNHIERTANSTTMRG